MHSANQTVIRAPQDSDLPILQALRNDVALQAQLMSLPRANGRERVQAWLGRLAEDPQRSWLNHLPDYGS